MNMANKNKEQNFRCFSWLWLKIQQYNILTMKIHNRDMLLDTSLIRVKKNYDLSKLFVFYSLPVKNFVPHSYTKKNDVINSTMNLKKKQVLQIIEKSWPLTNFLYESLLVIASFGVDDFTRQYYLYRTLY